MPQFHSSKFSANPPKQHHQHQHHHLVDHLLWSGDTLKPSSPLCVCVCLSSLSLSLSLSLSILQKICRSIWHVLPFKTSQQAIWRRCRWDPATACNPKCGWLALSPLSTGGGLSPASKQMKIRVKEAHPMGAFPVTFSSSFSPRFCGVGE